MLQKIKKIKLDNTIASLSILVIMLLLAFALFHPARLAGFVTDIAHFPDRFEGKDWRSIFVSFGYPGVQPLTMLFNYNMWTTFHNSPIPWYVLFTSVHAINAWLLFIWLSAYLSALKSPNAYLIGLITGLLFLVNPFSAEPVVWKCTFQYLLCTTFFFLSLIALTKYLVAPSRKIAALITIAFFASLLSFELSLGAPVIFLFLAWYFHKNITPSKPFAKRLQGVFYFPLLAIVLYFILTLIQTGSLIPHYGAATHLQFHVMDIIGNYFNYLAKYALDSRLWSPQFRADLRQWTQNHNIGLLALFFGIGLYLFCILLFKRISQNLLLSMLFLACFIAALIPVINLYFYDIGYIENDRYGYLACAFMYTIPAIWLSKIKGPFLGAAVILLLGFQAYFLLKMNFIWGQSAKVYNNLLDTYSWQDKPDVYVLALADNYEGALLFRDMRGEVAFSDPYTLISGHTIKGKIHDITQFNMNTATDGVTAKWK
ncbi:MAG: hypothetical protein ABIV51_08695, partial [Saprospiraceae bacterium]